MLAAALLDPQKFLMDHLVSVRALCLPSLPPGNARDLSSESSGHTLNSNCDVRYLLFSDSPAATNMEPLSCANHFHEQQNQTPIRNHSGSRDWGSHCSIQIISILSCGWGIAADISSPWRESL